MLSAHRQRAIEQALRIGVSLGSESYVFSDDGGVAPWNLSWPSHAWRQFSIKAGITPTRLHDYADLRVMPTLGVKVLVA
jgi:hypothetical protein